MTFPFDPDALMLAVDMAEHGEQIPEQAAPGRPRPTSRRGRRGGRSRSGGRSRQAQTRPEAREATAGHSPSPVAPPEAQPLVERAARLSDRVSSAPELHGSAIGQAIDEVTQIIESLRRAVEQMEEVLELVELAERQKTADERELDTLRRQLHRLHQPQERRSHGRAEQQ